MREPLRRALGARLKAARRAAGLTQGQAAAHLGTSRTNLTMWELGYHNVGYSRLVQLVALYRMDPATVFGDDLPGTDAGRPARTRAARREPPTTRRRPGRRPRSPVGCSPHHVARDVAAPAPDGLWIGDSTYVATGEGRLALAVLLDAHARRVIGSALADRLRTALALDAPAMARAARRPAAGLIHHTDRGGPYTAAAYRSALAAGGVTGSMRRAGDGDDNAPVARCFATRKAEVRAGRPWPTRRAARQALFAWLAVCYNRQRLHSALGFRSPVACALALATEAQAA